MEAGAMLPVGRTNVLVDFVCPGWNGSCGAPAVDVAPVSLTADGMVPLKMPCLSCAGVIGVAEVEKEEIVLVRDWWCLSFQVVPGESE